MGLKRVLSLAGGHGVTDTDAVSGWHWGAIMAIGNISDDHDAAGPAAGAPLYKSESESHFAAPLRVPWILSNLGR